MTLTSHLGLFVAFILQAISSTKGWTMVSPQTIESSGNEHFPSIRYGHKCGLHAAGVVCTHGYYFDRQTGDAQWKGDTWALKQSKAGVYNWRKLHDAISQARAYGAYAKGKVPSAPAGRFGFGAAVLDDKLFLYGGHDGGTSRTNKQNFEPGHDFDELWVLDLRSLRWSHVTPRAGVSPGKRYLLSMAAVPSAGALILYGGMQEGQGDVWMYSSNFQRWTKVAIELAGSQGPGNRVGHTIVAVSTPSATGFIMYGGRSASTVLSDAWFFDTANYSWRKLENMQAPAGRTYHTMALASVPLRAGQVMAVGVVAGGTLTSPRLTCTSEAWLFTYDCEVTRIEWHRLPDLPIAVYDLAGAIDGNQAMVFGGHLCNVEHGYPFYYTNAVFALDLQKHMQTAVHGCRMASTVSNHAIEL